MELLRSSPRDSHWYCKKCGKIIYDDEKNPQYDICEECKLKLLGSE